MNKVSMGTYIEMSIVVEFVTSKHFVSKIFQKEKIKVGVTTYFATVIERAILRKEPS
jgi:hypothetical protein